MSEDQKTKQSSKEVIEEKLFANLPKLGDKYFYSVGKRKSAIAQVRLYNSGKGLIYINGKEMKEVFADESLQQTILEPLISSGQRDGVNISIYVYGGGRTGQSIAVRHGISKALLLLDEGYRKSLKKLGFLTRDPRVKERKKPGLKKARRAPQWKKR